MVILYLPLKMDNYHRTLDSDERQWCGWYSDYVIWQIFDIWRDYDMTCHWQFDREYDNHVILYWFDILYGDYRIIYE